MSESRKKEKFFYYCSLLIQHIFFSSVYEALKDYPTHLYENWKVR